MTVSTEPTPAGMVIMQPRCPMTLPAMKDAYSAGYFARKEYFQKKVQLTDDTQG